MVMDKLLNWLEQWVGSNSDDIPEYIKKFLKEARAADGCKIDASVHNDPSSDSDSSISHNSSISSEDGM